MSGVENQLEARIRATQQMLRRHDNTIKEFEAHFDERPQAAAEALWLSLPIRLQTWRQHAISRFGVDLADREQRKHLRNLRVADLTDALEYTLLTIHYDTHDYALRHMIALRATEESGERLARIVCAAFLSALRTTPGIMAAAIEAFQKAVPQLANETGLAEYLTGYLATHVSLRVNQRLRAGIDERREHDESRFTRLLKELTAEALTVYDKRARGWGDLMDLRADVVRRLEKRNMPPDVTELVAFANRELLLKRAKAARLSTQEFEFYTLFIAGMKPKDVAEQKGVTPEHARQVKHRIKNKLDAAGL